MNVGLGGLAIKFDQSLHFHRRIFAWNTGSSARSWQRPGPALFIFSTKRLDKKDRWFNWQPILTLENHPKKAASSPPMRMILAGSDALKTASRSAPEPGRPGVDIFWNLFGVKTWTIYRPYMTIWIHWSVIVGIFFLHACVYTLFSFWLRF